MPEIDEAALNKAGMIEWDIDANRPMWETRLIEDELSE